MSGISEGPPKEQKLPVPRWQKEGRREGLKKEREGEKREAPDNLRE